MSINNDCDAWEAYSHDSRSRWIFNKLELAIRLGYSAGPAGVPIPRNGKYVIKPIYNLYGMGLGAEVVQWSLADNKKIEECEIISPGYMWCEYLKGPHYSVDYVRGINGWEPLSAMKGTNTEQNLIKFKKWERVEPPKLELPRFVDDLPLRHHTINVEMKGTQIFEIHLRKGNSHIRQYPIGTKLIPVWDENEPLDIPDKECVGNVTLPKIDNRGLTRYGFKVILNNS